MKKTKKIKTETREAVVLETFEVWMYVDAFLSLCFLVLVLALLWTDLASEELNSC